MTSRRARRFEWFLPVIQHVTEINSFQAALQMFRTDETARVERSPGGQELLWDRVSVCLRMDQQIVYVTGDGEYEIRQLNDENEETELTQEDNEERGLQQIEVHVEQQGTEQPETKEPEEDDDLRLECEEEHLDASPCKLVDRARHVNFPPPDPRQKRRMDSESKHLLAELLNLPLPSVLEKLRQLENIAHILSKQELTELTRAEVLNIL